MAIHGASSVEAEHDINVLVARAGHERVDEALEHGVRGLLLLLEDQAHDGLVLYTGGIECQVVLELLAGEHELLDGCRNALALLDGSLEGRDGIGTFCLITSGYLQDR